MALYFVATASESMINKDIKYYMLALSYILEGTLSIRKSCKIKT